MRFMHGQAKRGVGRRGEEAVPQCHVLAVLQAARPVGMLRQMGSRARAAGVSVACVCLCLGPCQLGRPAAHPSARPPAGQAGSLTGGALEGISWEKMSVDGPWASGQATAWHRSPWWE